MVFPKIHRNIIINSIILIIIIAKLINQGQGRCDGCTCEFTEQDKQEYLVKLQKAGIKNVEMEATIFGAMTHYTGIRAAIVCVTFLDRLKGDQVNFLFSLLNFLFADCLRQCDYR